MLPSSQNAQNRPEQLHTAVTVCSHVGTNRKQAALACPGPAPGKVGGESLMPMRHWRSRHAAHLLGSGGKRSAPCRLRQKYRGTVRRLGGPAASPACHGFSQPPHLQTRVPPAVSRPSAAEPSPLSTLAVTGRSPTFSPRHHAPSGYQRSHGLQASSGPGESYCGPAVVRIDCVSRQQSLDDADPISGTPGQKCAFRPLGVRPGVHAAILTCAGPDGGGDVSRETECAAGGPCSSNRDAPLKDTAPHPGSRILLIGRELENRRC